ncbi:hypothetical protein D3C77_627650 [compost metagenome]
MIEIYGLVAWVELVISQGEALLLAKFDRHAVGAMGDHVDRSHALAPLEMGTFRLVGGQGATPEEALWKSC